MNLKTNKLLILSLILILGTLLLVKFQENLGLGLAITSLFIILPYLTAFILNITGFFFGINEKTKNGKKPLTGIIGNGILILLFSSFIFFIITFKRG
ncbi:hypothetical protein [Tenacibaculum ovolyticum]|uniref:hypothetical protein n=1 Tax=Tenacibaculum ovolyticum TaxID=104270 RepID=UPI003BAB46A3